MLPISPLDGCDLFDDDLKLKGKIPLIVRGGCMFIHKVSMCLCVCVRVCVCVCACVCVCVCALCVKN